MITRYTVIDNAGSPVQFISDDMDGYTLKNVPQFKCYQFSSEEFAQAEINGVNRILKNDDFYNVYVSDSVELPLRVAGVKSSISIFEL